MQVQVAEGVDCGITLAPPYANPYNCDPSPLNEPDIVDPVTYNDPVITADPENGNPTPEPPLGLSIIIYQTHFQQYKYTMMRLSK